MLIVDVETTGVDANKNSIVSLAALDFENPENQFYKECKLPEGAEVDPYALTINGYTLEQLNDPKKPTLKQIMQEFVQWLDNVPKHTIAGENPSFDQGFIMAAARKYNLQIKLPYRTIDLHTLCYANHLKRNLPPPTKDKKTMISSDNIMEYVGIPAEPKPHIAINGAKWEAEAFSRLIYGKNLLKEFEQYPVPEYLKQ